MLTLNLFEAEALHAINSESVQVFFHESLIEIDNCITFYFGANTISIAEVC